VKLNPRTLLPARRRNLVVALVGALLLAALSALPAAAAACQPSSRPGGAYTVTVCITQPAAGATVSGSATVAVTVSVTGGTSPGVSKLVFTLAGQYLLTDFQAPYSFTLQTARFVDGTKLLQAQATMRDGFVAAPADVTLQFSNGVTQPPVNNGSFTPATGTPPAPGQPTVLAALGDGAGGEVNAKNVTDLVASWNPNMMLYLGDVYEKGTSTEFDNWYGRAGSDFFGRFRAITNPTVGNHEYEGGNAPGYFDYWDNVPHYFSFNVGGWHVISLDSTSQFSQTSAGSPQYQWLQNDLAANNSACTMAYFHHPVFSIGPQGDTPRMTGIWALLAQGGADIVLTAHDHNYQRWVPLNANGSPAAGGVTQFVVGTGGHSSQDLVRSDSRVAKSAKDYGALRLDLNQAGASYRFENRNHVTVDSGSLTCSSGADVVPPTAPTGLTATPTDPVAIRLDWTAATDNVGVTGYDVYRDGVRIAQIGPSTSYLDDQVVSGTTYQYHVVAKDAAGNLSPPSATATATAPGPVPIFSDSFESGDLSRWTTATGVVVQQDDVRTGSYAAEAQTTGAAAYASKTLGTAQSDLYYRLYFKVLSTGGQVYLNRLRAANGAAQSLIAWSVSSTGRLAYRNDVTGVSTTSTTVVPTGAWQELQVHVVINGTASQTETWLNGTRISALSKTESLGTTAVGRVQFGDNATGKTFDVAYDDITVDTALIH
jgi:Calcineurin-like phosphoesterase/Bacterial Ig domain